jgi:hypothetical protein
MSAETTSGGTRRPAILAVVAVVAIAALVAVLVTVRGGGPEVIRLGAAGSGGDATMEAASDAAMSRMAWVEHRFVLDDGARFAAGEGDAWRLEEPGDLRAAALDLARQLGLEGDEVASPWGDGSLQIGADDGSGPGLWVGPRGDWSFHDPRGVPEVVCVEPSLPAPEPGEGSAAAAEGSDGDVGTREELVDQGEEVVDDGDVVGDDVLIEDRCTPVDPPSGVPDEAAAREVAVSFFASLDLAATPRITDVYADEWSAWVTGRLPLGGADSDLFVSAAFGEDGALTSASGMLARPVEAGRYPTVDAEAAVARLSDPQGWFGGGVPMPADARLDVQVDLPDGAPAMDTPVEAPAEVDPDAPVDDEGEVSILPAPEPEGEPEVVEVTLVAAERALLQTVDVDGTIWLLPGVRFRSADGGEWQVLIVADEYLDADATGDGDGTEPGTEEPAPAPEPIPDPGTEPGGTGGGEPGDPGTGEPIDPGADPAPAPEDPDTGPAEEVAAAVVGLSEADAIARIEAEGFEHRIVRRDGEWFAVTDDWRTDRINLEVEGGTVVVADVG